MVLLYSYINMNKIKKIKYFMQISFCNDKVKKWPNFTKCPSVFFHGQRISKTAKFFEIWQPWLSLSGISVSFTFS